MRLRVIAYRGTSWVVLWALACCAAAQETDSSTTEHAEPATQTSVADEDSTEAWTITESGVALRGKDRIGIGAAEDGSQLLLFRPQGKTPFLTVWNRGQSRATSLTNRLQSVYGTSISLEDIFVDARVRPGTVLRGARVDLSGSDLLLDTDPCRGDLVLVDEPYEREVVDEVTCNGEKLEVWRVFKK